MQTTYRIKAQEISMTFLNSLKKLFTGQELEITVKSVGPFDVQTSADKKKLLEMVAENRKDAPTISPDIDIRGLIDHSQYPA